MRLIGIGMIGNFNYIGTSLNGSILEVKSKIKIPIQFLQKYQKQKMIEILVGLAIKN